MGRGLHLRGNPRDPWGDPPGPRVDPWILSRAAEISLESVGAPFQKLVNFHLNASPEIHLNAPKAGERPLNPWDHPRFVALLVN